MRTIDDFEFFYNFIEAKEAREKVFRVEDIPITFVIGTNDGTTFCISAHYDEVLLPFMAQRGQRKTYLKVIETDHGDYVCDYLEKVNNVIRRALRVPEVVEKGISFHSKKEDTEKPFFWTILKENIQDYIAWINGVKPIGLAA